MDKACKQSSESRFDSADTAQYTCAEGEPSQGKCGVRRHGLTLYLGSKGNDHASSVNAQLNFKTVNKQGFSTPVHANSTLSKGEAKTSARAGRNLSLPHFKAEEQPSSTTTSSTTKELADRTPDLHPYNLYPYYGFYSQEQSMNYTPSYPFLTPSSYSLSDEHGNDASSEQGVLSNDMSRGGGSTIITPFPYGVCYSMPMYQRPPMGYTGPSSVPMISYTYPPASGQGTMPASMGSDIEHTAHSVEAVYPASTYGHDFQSPPDSLYLNASPAMYSSISPGGGHGYGRYLYHDPCFYYNYFSGAPPVPPPHMIRSPVPLTPGYAVPSCDWPAYVEKQQSQQGPSAPRRRRTMQQPPQPQSSSPPPQPQGTCQLSSSTQSQKQKSCEKNNLKDPITPLESSQFAEDTSSTRQTVVRKLPCGDMSPHTPEVFYTPPTTKGACSENQLHGIRTNYVMWCGNVPSDATVEELWTFFSSIPTSFKSPFSHASKEQDQSPAEKPEYQADNVAGIFSIFIISKSSCAFVNYASQEQLDNACAYFHGRPLRTKSSCPRLVCRPRKLEDAEYAGVAAQRGKGVHTNWFRQQRKLHKARKLSEEASPETQQQKQEAHISDVEEDERSFSSTNSSLLRHPFFSTRYFILKSRSQDALVTALRTNTWSTQPHNEPVLDQAFRNSNEVILFFSENFSGQFFGYAVMTSRPGRALAKDRCAAQNSYESEVPFADFSGKSNGAPEVHDEKHWDQQKQQGRDETYAHAPLMSPETNRAPASELVSHDEDREYWSQASDVSLTPSMDAGRRAQEDLAVCAKLHNLRLDQGCAGMESLGGNLDEAKSKDGGAQSSHKTDTPGSEHSSVIHAFRSLQVGQPFYIEWKITSALPFTEINNLRNPWRDNRLIKVSRDGTELEPNVGRQLIAVWLAYLQKEKP